MMQFFSTLSLWTIVANGSPLSIEELQERTNNRKTVYLDGAVNCLKSLNLYPDCILGDFDSIDDLAYWGVIKERSLPYIGNFGVSIIPAEDQNHTDLEKGILYCDSKGADSIQIVQATGGRMDHLLGNLGLLKKYHRPNRELILLTENEQIHFLRDQEISIEGGIGGPCAILGYPEANITTSGLAYNSSSYLVKLGMQESICNAINEHKASISVEGEALVILPLKQRISGLAFLTQPLKERVRNREGQYQNNGPS